MRNVISLVLGGGRGSRLYPLTKYRSKPAAPLAAKYRLIDIPLSNCINSGLNRVYVLTQFLSVSLHRHIRQTYRFDHFSGGFVELLAAQQTMENENTDWYQGTADAVRKNLRYVDQPSVEHVVILSGDQLYRMDFNDMLQTHLKNDADVTIAALQVSRDDAQRMGIMRCDENGRVVGFLEKPQADDELKMMKADPQWLATRGLADGSKEYLASMGIYIFKRQTLVDALTKTNYEDFGREVFPASIRTRRVHTYLFEGFWEDIGTIRSFYDTNLMLAGPSPEFQFSLPQAPIFTRPRFLPPTVMQNATVTNSMIAEGCRIGQGAVIENSVIGLRSIIGDGAVIRNSILMGADFYESHPAAGKTPMGVGAESIVEGAILDKNCGIGRGSRVVNDQAIVDGPDLETHMIREGIPIVVKNSRLPDGWKL